MAVKLPINWGLIQNPLNWIIILLMILIAGLGVHAIFRAGTTEKGAA